MTPKSDVIDSVLMLKSDIKNTILDILLNNEGGIPPDRVERNLFEDVETPCITSYGVHLGDTGAFKNAGRRFKYCKEEEHEHSYCRGSWGDPIPEQMLKSLRFLQALNDILLGTCYNSGDPAKKEDVEEVLAILRQMVARTRVAFIEYEETGLYNAPNLALADRVVVTPPPSPQLPVVSSPTPPPPLPLLPSPFLPSYPPPASQPRTISDWLHHSTLPEGGHSSPEAHSTTSAGSTQSRVVMPSSKTSLASTASPFPDGFGGEKRKRDEEAIEDIPPRAKKSKYVEDMDLTEAYEADDEKDELADWGKGKMRDRRAIRPRFKPTTGKKKSSADKEIIYVPDSDEENDKNVPPMPPSYRRV
ncbi:hypothetical protein AAF712_013663 [Marasmius tenuissimus]|uniref:Uncharacterized protein n=1 Tax=Marasmius tenuissimus TaxID=585030 RepID=A0ABR2ZE14_9AGAR